MWYILRCHCDLLDIFRSRCRDENFWDNMIARVIVVVRSSTDKDPKMVRYQHFRPRSFQEKWNTLELRCKCRLRPPFTDNGHRSHPGRFPDDSCDSLFHHPMSTFLISIIHFPWSHKLIFHNIWLSYCATFVVPLFIRPWDPETLRPWDPKIFKSGDRATLSNVSRVFGFVTIEKHIRH